MAEFAAVPEFTVRLKTTEPNFDHTEFRADDGKWTPVIGDHFDWNAMKKRNKLEVRALNQMGRAGPATFLIVSLE